MSLKTPLGAARGLGSAKSGTHHWIVQRITAIALVPLLGAHAIAAGESPRRFLPPLLLRDLAHEQVVLGHKAAEVAHFGRRQHGCGEPEGGARCLLHKRHQRDGAA